jgi:hypothetical protein
MIQQENNRTMPMPPQTGGGIQIGGGAPAAPVGTAPPPGGMPLPPGGGNIVPPPGQYVPPPGAEGGMGQSPWSTMPPIRPPVDNAQNAGYTGYNPGTADWMAQGYDKGTSFGGQGTTGAQAGAADYAGVQGFADKAYEQARRNIDPMQEQQGRRMEQDLINKGIDPSSAQGKAMLDQQNRNFADQNNSAAFGALQFGQGIQNQMFGQNLANTQQAGDMQKASWQNQQNQQNVYGQKYGNELNAGVGWGNIGANYAANDTNRYLGDQKYALGQGNLEVGRQQQDFNELMGYDAMDYRNQAYNNRNQQWQREMDQALLTGNPPPYGGGYTGTQGSSTDPWAGLAGNIFGGMG